MMQMENKHQQRKPARVIKPINPSSLFINTTRYTSSMILYPMFPDRKACPAGHANTIFGRQFGIPCKISDKKWCIWIVTNNEMLCIYSIIVRNDNYVSSAQSDILNDLLPFIIPWKFWSDIMEDDNWSNNMLDYFTLGDTT